MENFEQKVRDYEGEDWFDFEAQKKRALKYLKDTYGIKEEDLYMDEKMALNKILKKVLEEEKELPLPQNKKDLSPYFFNKIHFPGKEAVYRLVKEFYEYDEKDLISLLIEDKTTGEKFYFNPKKKDATDRMVEKIKQLQESGHKYKVNSKGLVSEETKQYIKNKRDKAHLI